MREPSAARVPHMLACAKFSGSPDLHRRRTPPPVHTGGPRRETSVGSGGKLGTGEHMWDPCRGGLAHLSQHFWKKVLEAGPVADFRAFLKNPRVLRAFADEFFAWKDG